MMNIDDNGLFNIFPVIESIAKELEYQNSMLNKIVLTGKINALNIAENLFNFTEQTAQTFAKLQTELIENLLEENKKELLSKTKSKAKVAINTLNRILYERCNDIEILSQDRVIVDFLQNNISKAEVIDRLQQYVDKYSIYNEIIIFDTNFNLKANINKTNKIRYSKDKTLQKALTSNSFIQEYKKTDMFIKQRESLFFAKRVEQKDEIVGILVMFFDFKNEMDRVFKNLISDNEIITIVDNYNNVLTSSEKGIDKNFVKVVNRVDEYVIANDKFHIKTEPDSYEGYKLENWYAITSHSRTKDINIINEFKDGDDRQLAKIKLNNPELEKLASNGYAILEDLSDVIINGELIAAKSKQYILIPILDNLREVSFRVVKLIELSISNLQKIIDESVINTIKGLSGFIMDYTLRILYERSNDVRWWALNKTFIEELSTPNYSTSLLNNTLIHLNKLYPVYSDIFLYNTNGIIVASSNNQSLIGTNIPHNYTNSNKDSNRYFISPFEKTPLYNDKPTYIYYATIQNDKDVIGGIGVVFDSQTQFKKILDSFIVEKEELGFIINKDKQIISSTNENFDILSDFPFDIELKDGYISDATYNNKQYKITIKYTPEYREYKNSDLFAVVMKEK
jgi:hypothetical protein